MAIDIMAPSLLIIILVIFSNMGKKFYFLIKEIENSFYLGNYSLYLDYNENLFRNE